MTIATGNPITKADLEALISAQTTAFRTEAARSPEGYLNVFQFYDLTGEQTREFVMPRDSYLDSLAVRSGDMSGTLTVSLTGDGFVANWPIELSDTVSGIQELARTSYDNTNTKTRDRAFRMYNQGCTVKLTVDTTNVTVPSTLQVTLVFRQFYGR